MTQSKRSNPIQFPARLRFALERQLKDTDFRAAFDGELGAYRQYITTSFHAVLQTAAWTEWCESKGIDIVSWHYLTRHLIFKAAASNQYFSGQVIFSRSLRRQLTAQGVESQLEPYPGRRSPYIEIFKGGRRTDQSDLAGPVCIRLLADNNAPATPSEEGVLSIPQTVTKLLKTFPQHDGITNPLSEKHLNAITAADPDFLRRLTQWMASQVGRPAEEVQPLQALNYLQASLKVTLTLLKDDRFDCNLPRSTFLCPAYVGDEDVGGMAFACSGLVASDDTLVGGAVSDSLLTYLRLRENAEDAFIFERQRKLEEAKRFLIGRLSHDIRHPLDNLQSTAKDLHANVSEQVRFFDAVLQQLHHVNKMVDDTILALEGRDPQALLRPQKSEDKVSEILADIRALYRKRFEAANKEFTVVAPPGSAEWKIYLDAGMVHEILENLILNALEHGGTKTNVSVERESGHYLFHVRDSGKSNEGIKQDQAEAIFRPLAKPTESEGAVRGRGLAIARMLAQAHGGNVVLNTSESSWPTDFVLTIPAER